MVPCSVSGSPVIMGVLKFRTTGPYYETLGSTLDLKNVLWMWGLIVAILLLLCWGSPTDLGVLSANTIFNYVQPRSIEAPNFVDGRNPKVMTLVHWRLELPQIVTTVVLQPVGFALPRMICSMAVVEREPENIWRAAMQ